MGKKHRRFGCITRLQCGRKPVERGRSIRLSSSLSLKRFCVTSKLCLAPICTKSTK